MAMIRRQRTKQTKRMNLFALGLLTLHLTHGEARIDQRILRPSGYKVPNSLWTADLKSQILTVRGGQSSSSSSSSSSSGDPHRNYGIHDSPYTPPNDNAYPYPNEYGSPYDQHPPAPMEDDDAERFFHESVQQRVDRWRQEQLLKSQNLTPEQELNPRDEQGRMKLLASVSRGSRAVIFFILMWRDIHLFEIADQTFKGSRRLFAVIPLAILFIANMAGVVASLSAFSHATKLRMKAILNLDKLIEALLLVWYFIRLTVAPSKFVPREVFISNVLHSVFFLIQCQAFTRVTWDEIKPGSSVPSEFQELHRERYSNDPYTRRQDERFVRDLPYNDMDPYQQRYGRGTNTRSY